MPQPVNAPAGPRPWYHIGPVVALADDNEPEAKSTTADVYLYDVIGGFWGLTADDFVRDVAALDVARIELHLNTPGGEASEGVAIANMLRQHPASVRVWVDGMAASSGSVVAMAGDEIIMGLGSQMMVHNPRTWAVGDEDELDKAIRGLRSTGEAIAETYAAKAGGTTAEWRQVMKAETWYSAEEAVKAGLADRVATDDDKGAATGQKVTPGRKTGFWDLWDSLSSPDRADLSQFLYQGRQKAPAPRVPARRGEPSPDAVRAALAAAAQAVQHIHNTATKTPAADPASGPSTKEGAAAMQFTDEERAGLRTRYGLAADADDDAIKAALLAPPSAPPTNQVEPASEQTQPPAPKASAVPPGMRLIADSAWQAQQDRIRRLEARETKRERDERDQVIAQAVKDGRFTVAQKAHFAKLWDADPEGTRNLIASLQKNVALAVAELGHAGEEGEVDAEFAEFDDLYPPHQRLAKTGKVT